MSSGLTDDDKERIQTFSETPSYARSPEDLTPERTYADEVRVGDESDQSLLAALWHRLRNR